jgi:hypothetical protein
MSRAVKLLHEFIMRFSRFHIGFSFGFLKSYYYFTIVAHLGKSPLVVEENLCVDRGSYTNLLADAHNTITKPFEHAPSNNIQYTFS